MNNQNSPLISVLCCLYNTPSHLFKKSLQSAVKQNYKNFEFIIMNDGSDQYLEENTKLIEDLHDKRFKLYHKEHNGKSNTLNTAIKLCKGKYIAIWDSDDIFNENRFEYQVSILENTNIECISNAMEDSLGIVYPAYNQDSQYITKSNIHYLAFHPCQMFNREIVLNKVPYLFENCYDSMEDSIFNHVMFYHHVNMYYDNKILGNYCIENLNGAHKKNLYGYLKFCTENLRYKYIDNYFNKVKYSSRISVILLINEQWKDEIEKTIFNLRITANDYIDIIVAQYGYDDSIHLELLEKNYNIKFVQSNTFIQALNSAILVAKNELLYIISNPIRMCTEMWDWRICRFIDNEVSDVDKVILQPLMFDMEKQDDNYYVNSRGQYEKHNIQYGERLTMLTEDLSEKIEEDSIKSEYIMYRNIPLLNDSLCFIVSKNNMINMMNYIYCGPDLLNIIISLLQYNSGNNVYLYYDVNVSLHQIISNKKNSFIYYSNYIYIVNTFFTETRHIYKHILSNSCGLSELEYNTYLNVFNTNSQKSIPLNINLEKFYKNINCKQPWII